MLRRHGFPQATNLRRGGPWSGLGLAVGVARGGGAGLERCHLCPFISGRGYGWLEGPQEWWVVGVLLGVTQHSLVWPGFVTSLYRTHFSILRVALGKL